MDWQKIINDVLEHNKFTQTQLHKILVKSVKISPAYICELKKGKKDSPSFDIGLAIIKLHPNKEEILNSP